MFRSFPLRRIQTHLLIAEQSKALVRAKEIESIHAMVATFHHEINNPLAIAVGHVAGLRKKCQEEEHLSSLEKALWRIAETIRKVKKVLETGSMEYQDYSENIKILDVSKVSCE